ncbi:amidase [Segnochrobactrum spirostomi]|uniref:Amidase n=1 Tax=Segnochrobactrum spirostomi TaxID=2608987 RepID=A0A6A7Y056_9HYPH|nr:amidase [Segnochrobactrum spirostomi]MQT11976.1 amidase [Segnochrobactrum spirostomi]
MTTDLAPSIVQNEAVTLVRALRDRTLSAVEVMNAFLDQIERLNPLVNAIVALRPRDELLREAAACDRASAAGEPIGLLHGLPWAVKDLEDTKGIVTTYGSPLFRDHVPDEDGLMPSRLRCAGAIFIGKTNVPEFGFGSQTYNPVYGATGNAWDPSKTAGGSSGGAGAALALNLVPAADGSDMMGSLRNPAAFNGVFGFRPSAGRVPYGPRDDVFLEQLACEGPMGRSVADVALQLSVQAGPDASNPLSIAEDAAGFAAPLARDFAGTRIGWVGDFGGYLAMEPGVLTACEKSFAGFEAAGCVVEPVAEVGYPLERLWEAWLILRQVWSGGGLLAFYEDPAQRALLKPEIQWEIEGASRHSGLDVRRAGVIRSDWYRALLKLFERYDFLLAPVAQVFPFDKTQPWPRAVGGRTMDTYHRWMEATSIWTLAGLPALAVPAGFSSGGLPTGVQIIGPNRADLAVLQVGHAYDLATRATRPTPPLLRA